MQKDTLETLSVCLPIYGPFTVLKFAKQLWNTMKLEASRTHTCPQLRLPSIEQVFQPVNPEIETEALHTTEALIKTLYEVRTEAETSSTVSMDFLTELCEECLSLMDEPEKSQAIPASKVIAALIGTTCTLQHSATTLT